MPDAEDMLKVAVLIPVALIIVSAIGVTAMGALNDDFVTEKTQNEDETVDIKSELTSNLTRINSTSNEVDVLLETNDNSATATISQGSTTTITIDGVDVESTVKNIQDNSTARMKYRMPNTAFWNSATVGVFALIGILGLLAIGFAFLKPVFDF